MSAEGGSLSKIVAIFRLGKTKEGTETGPGPRNPDSVCVGSQTGGLLQVLSTALPCKKQPLSNIQRGT